MGTAQDEFEDPLGKPGDSMIPLDGLIKLLVKSAKYLWNKLLKKKKPLG